MVEFDFELLRMSCSHSGACTSKSLLHETNNLCHKLTFRRAFSTYSIRSSFGHPAAAAASLSNGASCSPYELTDDYVTGLLQLQSFHELAQVPHSN